jgi:hypothetical protein
MISKESLSFLEKGQTTKDEVRETLGEPQDTNETGSEWVYELRLLMSGRWGFCIAIPPGYGNCGVSDGKAATELLRIDFDDAGVVTGWDRFRGPPGTEHRSAGKRAPPTIHAPLTIGVTTREEIYAGYGEPEFGNAAGSSALYTETGKQNLYLEYSDQDVLRHVELIDDLNSDPCVATGICIISYGSRLWTFFIIFTRPPFDDREAKQFNQAAGRCSVYLFGDIAYDREEKVTAWHFIRIDEQLSALSTPSYYLNWQLSPGQHLIQIQNADRVESDVGPIFDRLFGSDGYDEEPQTVSHSIECVSGDVYFLALAETIKTGGVFNVKALTSDFSLTPVQREIGEPNVRKRILASGSLHFPPEVEVKLSSPTD